VQRPHSKLAFQPGLWLSCLFFAFCYPYHYHQSKNIDMKTKMKALKIKMLYITAPSQSFTGGVKYEESLYTMSSFFNSIRNLTFILMLIIWSFIVCKIFL
jgi:hypothetical protein